MSPSIRANISQTMSDETGEVIPHSSEPVISTSNTLWFPILKAVTDDRRPELTDYNFPFYAARQCDAVGTPHYFVNEAVLQAAKEQRLHSFIYGLRTPPLSAHTFDARADLDEWRVPELSVQWDWAARVDLYDLPDHTLVMRAKAELVWPFLHGILKNAVGEPAELTEAMDGVSVMTFHEWRSREL